MQATQRLSNRERKSAAKAARKEARRGSQAKKDAVEPPPSADPVGSTAI